MSILADMIGKQYTCRGKGGNYKVEALSKGAGTMKSFGGTLVVYRDTVSGEFYHRTVEDFLDRMEVLHND